MAFSRHANSEIAVVAPGEGRMFYDWCRENGYVTIGWLQSRDLEGLNYAAIKQEFQAYYPLGSTRAWDSEKWTTQKHDYAIGVIADFVLNLPVGRRVLMPNAGSATLSLGTITGNYEHRTDLEPSEQGYEHFHRVHWDGEVHVSELSVAKSIHWSDRRTLWWIEVPNRIRDILEAANRHSFSTPSVEFVPMTPLDEADEFPEGRELYLTHRTRERNPKAVQAKKSAVRADTGHLACEACGFDFESVYREVGRGYIECHHVTPISEYGEDQSTTLEDLALVCANCHRMLHRERPWMTVEQLGEHLRTATD